MKTFVGGLALAAIFGGTALAATTPTTTSATRVAAPTSTAQAEAVAPASLLDKMQLNFFSSFYGPSLSAVTGSSENPTSKVPNVDGSAGDPIYFENVVRGGYKLSDSVSARVAAIFNYSPVLGQDVTLLDPYVQLAHSKVVSAGNFSLAGDVRFYIPASDASQNANLITAVRSTQSATYKVGNSRWTLGLDTFVRGYVFGSGAPAGRRVLQVLASPNVVYQATPTLAAQVVYEAVARTNVGAGIDTWASEGTWIYPGVSWDVTSSINLNPYLGFQSLRINPESTYLGLNLSAKIL